MVSQICHHHKFGYCRFKEQCEKEHVKEECQALSACKEVRSCNKRHPKTCKRLVLERFCKFGDECAYLHLTRDNSKEVYTEVIEEVKNLKAEVDLLKKTVKSLSHIKEEAKGVKEEIKMVKEKISQLKAENLKMAKKISMIEEDLESESESEGGEDEAQENVSFDGIFSCEHCNTQFVRKSHFEKHIGGMKR